MKRAAILLLALAAAGCTAGGGGKSGASARMVKPAELPERQREVLEAWKVGGEAWANQRAAIESDPELARFLVDNLVVQMVRSFDRSALGSAVRPESPFSRAQAELIRLPGSSVPVLVELLLVGDDIVAFLAADTLKHIGAAAVDPVAAKLGAAQPELRRRVVELLEALPESPTDEPAILGRLGRIAERDDAWIVRAQAVRSLGARAARRTQKGFAAAVLARALADPDPEVQKTALEALAVLGDSTAVPALIRRLERAANEGDLPALHAAQAALRRLTGEQRDLDPEDWWKRWSTREPPGTPGAPGAKAPR